MDIQRKIIQHRDFYEMNDVDIPPYRITCKEHKELRLDIMQNEEDKKNGERIGYFYDVELQLVVEVEDY